MWLLASILDSTTVNAVGHRTWPIFLFGQSEFLSWYQPQSWPIFILTPCSQKSI